MNWVKAIAKILAKKSTPLKLLAFQILAGLVTALLLYLIALFVNHLCR